MIPTVTGREDLATALSQAEDARDRLEATLFESEAALQDSVLDSGRSDANLAEAAARVEKARVRCRELRAALNRVDSADLLTRSRKRTEASVKTSVGRPEQDPAADPSTVRSSEPAVPGERNLRSLSAESGTSNPAHRFRSLLRVALLARDTVGLLILVLAYLQYYYLDIQLQIMKLPVLTLLPPG